MLQQALERTTDKVWPIYFKDVVRKSLGMRGAVDAGAAHVSSDLRIYGKKDDREGTPVWFSEVPAAYNTWTRAADIPAYLKQILKDRIDPDSFRGAGWQTVTEPDWETEYLSRSSSGIGAPCAVNLFESEGFAMFWFSNRRGSTVLSALRKRVLQDVLNKQNPESKPSQAGLGGGFGGRLNPPKDKRGWWRGTLQVGHPKSVKVPIDLVISPFGVLLRDGVGVIRKYKLRSIDRRVHGTIYLRDGSTFELSLKRFNGEFRGLGVWREGDNLCLPCRVALAVAAEGSVAYPRIRRK